MSSKRFITDRDRDRRIMNNVIINDKHVPEDMSFTKEYAKKHNRSVLVITENKDSGLKKIKNHFFHTIRQGDVKIISFPEKYKTIESKINYLILKCENLLIFVDRVTIPKDEVEKISWDLAKTNLIDIVFVSNNLCDIETDLLNKCDFLQFNQENPDLNDPERVKKVHDKNLFIFLFFQFIKMTNDMILEKIKEESKNDPLFDENDYIRTKELEIIFDLNEYKLINDIHKDKIEVYAEQFVSQFVGNGQESHGFTQQLMSNLNF